MPTSTTAPLSVGRRPTPQEQLVARATSQRVDLIDTLLLNVWSQ
jgi:hypothetical protein